MIEQIFVSTTDKAQTIILDFDGNKFTINHPLELLELSKFYSVNDILDNESFKLSVIARDLRAVDESGSEILIQLSDGIIIDHLIDTDNPHEVTKEQVGLGNVLDVEQIPVSEKGQPGGVAELDEDGKVPISQINIGGGLLYQSAWDADANEPELVSSEGTQGYYYVVNVPGSTNLNGIVDWKNTDWAVFNGSAWEKVDNSEQDLSDYVTEDRITIQECVYIVTSDFGENEVFDLITGIGVGEGACDVFGDGITLPSTENAFKANGMVEAYIQGARMSKAGATVGWVWDSTTTSHFTVEGGLLTGQEIIIKAPLAY